ncbi:MAG: hypothetical protein ACRDOK_18445 [Streptosporangiaceae bacterium]
MIDSKSVVQEVQKELLAVVQRGHEQVRKGQDRVRKSHEQARKSRDAVVSVVRAGSELAKAVRPSVPMPPSAHIPSPATVRAHAQELAGQAISAQRGLADKARHAAGPYAERVLTAQRELADMARHAASPYAEHVTAAQRSLAGRVSEVAKAATPLLAEGRTMFTQLVSALQPGHPAAGTAEGTARKAAATSTATAQPEADAPDHPAAPQLQTPAKPKARTSKASTAKTGTAKTGTAKIGARPTPARKPRSAPKK